ncbi:hypothetical protein DQ04_03281020 [Trypanosoma grayi]|uniref:hypothetical protein n=1 Tax=Trypanosoma grayi TaxID=71804 RepID=UPI0004F42242|nr:hypothetical protein DQ04_03281020 [Trypanosoma grayi]KEG10799.1 hypothetical protein DQ04_03281020 [Trypanosoma grayi]
MRIKSTTCFCAAARGTRLSRVADDVRQVGWHDGASPVRRRSGFLERATLRRACASVPHPPPLTRLLPTPQREGLMYFGYRVAQASARARRNPLVEEVATTPASPAAARRPCHRASGAVRVNTTHEHRRVAALWKSCTPCDGCFERGCARMDF